MQRDYGYYKRIFSERPMPFAFVDLDLLEENIDAIVQRAQGRSIRVASKSVRCVEALRHVFGRSPLFRGIMAYTAREALHLAGHGFDDILLGYPIWHSGELREIARAVASGKRIVCMVDSVAHVEHIQPIAQAARVALPVCIDLDVSTDFPGIHFGSWRSPLKRPEEVVALAERIRALPNLRLAGLMGYEGQIAGVPDNAPRGGLKNHVVRFLKKRSIRDLTVRRRGVIEALRAAGHELDFVNGGGTGSIESTIVEPYITEVTVGSGFFSPGLFDGYRAFRHQPAAAYAIEITRIPAPGLYTCLGGGYIASGATGPEKQPRPYLPEGASLLPLEGAGEVQTPIAYKGPEPLALGDPVFLRHSKAGELCERFNSLLVVRKGGIVAEWPTYRGEGQAFL